mmetsp:Transcript_4062/g.5954  ORF Transcript_4062/g.5954 Transcript_4062/m.5954 type:complete len:115 (+) Transcript_4062:25-369(+)
MAETPTQKQLRIKLGVCKRLVREMSSYEEEVQINEARVQKMKAEEADEYDIRKQEEVLGESHMMIPDTRRRMDQAFQDLAAFLEENEDDADISGTENLEEARKLCSEHNSSEEG